MIEDIQDRILFGLPADPELYLAALAAVQDYGWQLVRQRKHNRREGEWLMAIHSPNPQMDFLKTCFPKKGDWFEESLDGRMIRYTCPVDTQFTDEWEPRRGEWDFVYQFNVEEAYQMSLPTQKSAATTFGMLIGSAPATEMPELKDWKREGEPERDVAVMPFEGRDELLELLEMHHPELSVGNFDWGDELLAGAAVIGPRSLETYLAASTGLGVVELYPLDRHPKWLAKWGSSKYQQVYGERVPPELLWRVVEGEVDKWLTHKTTPIL